MAKVNFKSDFDFLLGFKTCDAQQEGVCAFPPATFRGTVTSGVSSIGYDFSWDGEKGENCRKEGARLRVICDSHGLGAGKVRVDLYIDLPDEAYPDTIKTVHSVHDTGIELVRGNGDCCEEPLDIELIVNWALVTAYDIAVAKGGYTGSMEEFYTALNSIPDASAVLQEARETAQAASQIADSMSLLVPQEKTEEEMEQMIAEGTCVEGQIYFTPED